MAITTIAYGKETYRQAKGRNGFMRQMGIEICQGLNDEIYLTPVTTRGSSEAARLVIPGEHLSTVIAALQELSA